MKYRQTAKQRAAYQVRYKRAIYERKGREGHTGKTVCCFFCFTKYRREYMAAKRAALKAGGVIA